MYLKLRAEHLPRRLYDCTLLEEDGNEFRKEVGDDGKSYYVGNPATAPIISEVLERARDISDRRLASGMSAGSATESQEAYREHHERQFERSEGGTGRETVNIDDLIPVLF